MYHRRKPLRGWKGEGFASDWNLLEEQQLFLAEEEVGFDSQRYYTRNLLLTPAIGFLSETTRNYSLATLSFIVRNSAVLHFV